MARPDLPRSIVEFQRRFADEADCLDYLAWSRWPEGFRCPACGGRRGWVLARRHLWECVGCGRQTSVTAGTVMDHTHTPLVLWFWSAYLVATHTPGISAKQLQRQLGIGRYEIAWFILQKLRRAMIAPDRGLLIGEVEVDEAFIGGRNPARRGGRDRIGKVLVGVAVEARGTSSGWVRLQVLPNANSLVQDTKCPAVGNTAMDKPTSAMIIAVRPRDQADPQRPRAGQAPEQQPSQQYLRNDHLRGRRRRCRRQRPQRDVTTFAGDAHRSPCAAAPAHPSQCSRRSAELAAADRVPRSATAAG